MDTFVPMGVPAGGAAPVWPKLVPLKDTSAPPQFPVEALPKPIADYVDALSVFTQTPPSMGGVLALGVMSIAFQRIYEIRIRGDWSETLSLYCVAVAQPAERKSAVLSQLLKPVRDYEQEYNEKRRLQIAISQRTAKALTQKVDRLTKELADGKAEQEQLDAAVAERAEAKVMVELQLVADDATPEALVQQMQLQGGNMAICAAEASVFEIMSGRYGGKQSSNLEVYLQGITGEPIRSQRKTTGSTYVSHPHLTMCLAIQPTVLEETIRNSTWRGRGLCGRFTFAACTYGSKLGNRDLEPPEIPAVVKKRYQNLIRAALVWACETVPARNEKAAEKGGVIAWDAEIDDGEKTCGFTTLELHPDAYRRFTSWRATTEARLAGRWKDITDWAGKIEGCCARIAALIHCTEEISAGHDPAVFLVSLDAVERAIRIMECLSVHAEKAFSMMGADEFADARYIWERCRALYRKTGNRIFSQRDLRRTCKDTFKNSDNQLADVLDQLADLGYIRTYGPPYSDKSSTLWEINPAALQDEGVKYEPAI